MCLNLLSHFFSSGTVTFRERVGNRIELVLSCMKIRGKPSKENTVTQISYI